MPEGRQSPPPESQTGAQLNDTPAHGQGLTSEQGKADTLKSELNNLPSNPKGPLDDELQKKFEKTEQKNCM